MQIGETLYVVTGEEWRSWLEDHWDRSSEIWLVSYRKETGRPSIAYEVAVKEALCFGWIDSTRKGLDGDRYAQRYSPRRPGSGYSQTNLERLAVLARAGRVSQQVLAALGEIRPESYEVPADIVAALQADPRAWEHWLLFSPAYRRIRAAYVDEARGRGEDFERRLATLIERTARGRQFGYGIEEFYV